MHNPCRFIVVFLKKIEKRHLSIFEALLAILSPCDYVILQKYLNIQLERADGVPELEALEDGGMQDAEDADDGLFAADTEVDCGGVAGEECWIYLISKRKKGIF